MLENALLYKEEILAKTLKIMYDPKYKFLSGTTGVFIPNLNVESNTDQHIFASVLHDDDEDEINGTELIGYIMYYIDWPTKSACRFGMVSFSNPESQNYGKMVYTFSKDMETCFKNVFTVYGLNRLEFGCIDGNPVKRTYDRLVKKYNGSIAGHCHQCCQTSDGVIRDSYTYEFMREDFLNACKDK